MPDDAIERARECLTITRFKAGYRAPLDTGVQDAIVAAMIAFASQQAPEGWRLIPIGEPTEAMWNAAWEASEDYFVSDDITQRGFRLGLSAMLDAAPSVTLGEVG